MFIKTIEGRLKAGSFSHQLSRKTIISGPNGSGKTAIANAVRIALLGREPAVGKTNAATFLLAQGDLMSARATFDGGGFIERTFRRSGGGVKQEVNVGGEEVDPEVLESLTLLDPAAYFEMTASERISHLFANFKLPDEMKPTAILAQLERISFDEEHTELIEVAKAKTINDCRLALAAGVVAGLDRLVADGGLLKTEFTRWNRQAKDSAGAIRTLAELRLRESECSAETLLEINGQLEVAGARREECAKRNGQLAEQMAHWQRLTDRKKVLQGRIEEPIEPGEDKAPALAELRERPLPAVPEAPSRQEALTFDDETTKLRTERGILLRTANDLREAINTAETNLAGIKGLDHCPTCLAKGKGWRDGIVTTINIDIAAKHTQIQAVLEKITEQDAALLDREKQRDEILCKQNARVEAEAAHAEREKAVTRLQAIVDQRANMIKAYEQKRAQMREELAAIVIPEVSQEAVAQASADLTTASKECNELVVRRDAALRLRHDLERAAQADKEARLAEAYTKVIKRVGEELKKIQLEIVTKAFDSILVTANRLCEGILPGPLDFRGGEVGYSDPLRPLGFVHYRAMSGSERTMTDIAIATAIAADAPVRIAIIDEFANLTDNTQNTALRNLETLVDEGVLDQVLVLVPLDPDEQGSGQPREGWAAIELGEVAA